MSCRSVGRSGVSIHDHMPESRREPMNLPQIVSREEWLVARKDLLAREKELTRARDAFNADRRRLPMVEIDREYVFEGPDGKATLLDLFDGRRQLIVYHFMFASDWDEGCPSCSAGVDEMSDGSSTSPARRWTSSRPTARARAGPSPGTPRTAPTSTTTSMTRSTSPWHRSSTTTATGRTTKRPAWAGCWTTSSPSSYTVTAASCATGTASFHTYSMYARAAETVDGSYYFLDLIALGRQEDWEQPGGRSDAARAAAPDFST
jgi:predicted dithiol-disulfide oxidoreductase (DUF899 family)